MGKLFIVPTPIGNLEDITLRAIRILKEADSILAEDTRVTRFLLQHLGIDKPIYSHHQHNEHKTLETVITKLNEGLNIALVSDAGTPGISDPGFLLVRKCVENNIEVETLPGPTAFVPALVNSGFPCDKFVFEGFLPQKKGRKTRLEKLALEERTIVLYESPFRVLKCLEELLLHFGETRKASVSRELSKKFEETVRGTFSELITHFKNKAPKGEFVMVIEGRNSKEINED